MSRQTKRRRRQIGGERLPGFTPIENKRIAAAIAKAVAAIGPGMDPIQSTLTAIRQVARTLPHLPICRRHRALRPSKSDDPVYRKAVPAA